MIGRPLHIMGSKNLYKYLTDEIEQETGGKYGRLSRTQSRLRTKCSRTSTKSAKP